MGSNELHEAADKLSEHTREMHRALVSLIEELEAVDWYAQRVDASQDPELRRVLAHNRDEEKEHACMTLEWIRRQDPKFDEFLRRFLFTTGPIPHSEETSNGSTEQHTDRTGSSEGRSRSDRGGLAGGLGIGSLRHSGDAA